MYAVVPGLVMEAGMAVLGIFTSIGLLRLRRWARYSTLVFAGILVFIGILLLALAMAFFHFAPQGVSAQARVTTQAILCVIFLIPIGIGTWWLWMFNTAKVKAQFAGAATEQSLAAASTALPVVRPLKFAR